eukprot:TRINITY_DN43653_c0_g1_i1.p1 TRINITY_DN43653_c0_g1~~TRINITY_DN43653_c0_g1_i1.p1  ORF type:complete len:160 (+),score=26.04 TRINITY_DN43653_c0_g1_i1:27-482(+)
MKQRRKEEIGRAFITLGREDNLQHIVKVVPRTEAQETMHIRRAAFKPFSRLAVRGDLDITGVVICRAWVAEMFKKAQPENLPRFLSLLSRLHYKDPNPESNDERIDAFDSLVVPEEASLSKFTQSISLSSSSANTQKSSVSVLAYILPTSA